MADPVNSDVQRAFALINGPFAIIDDQVANVISSQATALRARGQIFVVTQGVTNANVVLPSLNSGNDAPPVLVVVNETLNNIRLGAAPGDLMNGTATAANFATGFLILPTRSSAVCIASQSPLGAGGGSTASPNNWHAAVFS